MVTGRGGGQGDRRNRQQHARLGVLLFHSTAEDQEIADLTLILGRLPASEWIGLEVSGHLGHDGIAVGSCTLYDTSGAIGWSSVCAITNTATLAD